MHEIVEPHTSINPRSLQQFFVNAPDRIRTPHPVRLARHKQVGAVRVTLMPGNEQVPCLLGRCNLADGVLCLELGHHQFTILPGYLLIDCDDAASYPWDFSPGRLLI